MAKKKKEPLPDKTEMEAPVTAHIEEELAPELPTFKDEGREAIYAKYKEHQDAQEPKEEIVPEEPVTEEPVAAVADAPLTEDPPAPADPAGSPPEPSPQKFKLTVNGQVIEVTTEEALILAQKGIGAEKKFEEAARLRQEAEALRNSQPQAANPPAQLPDIPKEELLDIAKRLNYGTEEEQAEAISKAIAIGTQQGRNFPTPEQLVHTATQNALSAITTQREDEIIFNEYQDVLKDPALAAAAAFTANQIAMKAHALGQHKSRLQIMQEAGNEIRAKYLRPVQTQTPAPAVVVNPDKIERKRAAPQPPAAANAVATTGNAKSAANPEDVLQQMRKNAFAEIAKSRGQAAYN